MTRIAIQNVIQPGKTYNVDAARFGAMRDAMLAVLPDAAPGLTVAEVKASVLLRRRRSSIRKRRA